MSEVEHAPGEANDGTPRRPRSFWRHVFEWFWRGEALAEQHRGLSKPGEDAFDFARRAKHCDSLARVAWTTGETAGEGIACELFRQSAYWALCALRRGQAASRRGEYAASVWSTLESEGLAADIGAALRPDLGVSSFDHFADLPEGELSGLCSQLQGFTTTLLGRVAAQRRGYERVLRQRAVRLAALLLAVAAVGAGFHSSKPKDLAAGTVWHTSSAYTSFGGCASPDQTCGGAKDGWFFHTDDNDRDPWIEFELDGNELVSQVEVENRTDCCAERAIPLVIEVSIDHNSWDQVARREAPFSTWKASFPRVLTSWVRLRVLGNGPLHLRRVQIFK